MNHTIKFFAAPQIMAFVTILNISMYTIFFGSWLLFFDIRLDEFILKWPIFSFLFLLLPTFLWFTRVFSVVELNEHGIKKSNFRFFCCRIIKWTEISEIKYYNKYGWVIVSKRPLHDINFNFVIERRDVIPFFMRKSVICAISNYTEIKITGLKTLDE